MNGNDSTDTDQIELMQKIQDVSENERFELAIRKMDFCRLRFANSHTEFEAHNQSPNGKNSRQIISFLSICVIYLEELIEYFGTAKESICERIYPSLFEIISNKIYDDLHPPLDDERQWQGEEEEEAFPKRETDSPRGEGSAHNAMDKCHFIEWTHSKLVYDLFLLVIESDKFRVTQAKDFVDQPFVRRLITNLAICSQSEERQSLARILRRIYVKFVRFRPHIRKHLTYTLEEAVFDEESQLATTKTFHGIAEILDIFENIINGFKVPLKSDEQQILFKVLLPLHKIDFLEHFYKMLICRVLQLLELCPQLTPAAIDKMLKWWPKTNGQKECIFLEELELILTKVEDQRILSRETVVGSVFVRLAKCLSSQHFQVSIKALNFWKNERILQLIRQNSAQFVHIVYEPLEQTAKNHWSTKVQAEARDFQNILMEMNWKAYSKRKNCEKEEEMPAN